MNPSLLSKLSAIPFAFLDVETTGASPDYGDRVIELGIARIENGQIATTFSQLLNPRRPIGPGITAITGITNEMVADQPLFSDIAREALDLLRGAVLVGHNIPFDLSFLRSEFRKAGIDLTVDLAGAHILDTVRIAQKRFGRGGNGLQNLAARFEVRDPTAHRALADVLTTYRVFDKLIEPLGSWSNVALVDLIQAQGGLVRLEGNKLKRALPLELEEALDRGGPVEMEYVDIRESRTVRIITPIEVRRFRGEMILLAWCAMRQDRRTFKLDRIVRLTKVDPEAQLPPSTSMPMEPEESQAHPQAEQQGLPD